MMVMCKKVTVLLLLLVVLLLSSCDKIGGIYVDDDKKADARMEQIISAIKEKDSDALKSLFSERALGEADDFETDIEYLFKILQGDIDSWERDGLSSEESIRYGKKTLMIRFAFDIKTDKDLYLCYLIDYITDTINPDNEGVYMLELRLPGSPNTGAWQERMRAGLYIH